MSWIVQIPILVAMLIVAWVPGWPWARVISARFSDQRVNTLVQLAAAPLITFAAIVVLGLVFTPSRGLAWTPEVIIPILLVFGLVGLIVDFLIRRGRRRAKYQPWKWDWQLIGVIAGSVLLAALPLLVMAKAYNPLQQWDSSFHLNGVWTVVTTQNASLLNALAPMYALGNTGTVYYPDGWHAFTALFATKDTVVQAVNTSSLAIIVFWVVGMAALAQVLWNDRFKTLIVAVLSGLMLSFPADFVSMYSQWPNATSMALQPALLALAWITGKAWVRSLFASGDWKHTILWSAFFGVASLGALAVHPIAFFNALVFVLIPLGASLIRLIRSTWKGKDWGRFALLAGTAFVALILVVVAFFNPKTQGVAAFTRSTSWLDAFARMIVPVPPFPMAPGFILFIAVFLILLVVGLRAASKIEKGRWMIGTWAIFAVLVFLSYAPNFGLKILTGPWYSDPRRIMAAMQVIVVLLLALAVVEVTKWAMAKRPMHRMLPLLLVVVLSGAGAIDARALAVRNVYDPDNLGPAGMATQSELDLFRDASKILPEDAVIFGDPSAGTVYFQVLGNRKVLYPQLTITDRAAINKYMVRNFHNIHTDPRVCEMLNENNIHYFYAAKDEPYYKRLRSERIPALYMVDTSTGFKEIARADTGVLYEITECQK